MTVSSRGCSSSNSSAGSSGLIAVAAVLGMVRAVCSLDGTSGSRSIAMTILVLMIETTADSRLESQAPNFSDLCFCLSPCKVHEAGQWQQYCARFGCVLSEAHSRAAPCHPAKSGITTFFRFNGFGLEVLDSRSHWVLRDFDAETPEGVT